MAKEMSAKDREMKAMMEEMLANPDMTWIAHGRLFFGKLPSDPRCASCLAPFEGMGGAFARTFLNRKRSQSNPLYCTFCEDTADLEKRTLSLKGKSEPMDVWVLAVKPS